MMIHASRRKLRTGIDIDIDINGGQLVAAEGYASTYGTNCNNADL
jgi:hypothetical protein